MQQHDGAKPDEAAAALLLLRKIHDGSLTSISQSARF
jgi:hypothetical protein